MTWLGDRGASWNENRSTKTMFSRTFGALLRSDAPKT
jgi:hypothetical protein